MPEPITLEELWEAWLRLREEKEGVRPEPPFGTRNRHEDYLSLNLWDETP